MNRLAVALVMLARAHLDLQRGDASDAAATLREADTELAALPHAGMLATLAQQLRAQLATGMGPTECDLNARAIQVLTAIADGAPRRQAAEQLHLSINTVKTYLRTAYRKLNATGRGEAMQPLEPGLIPQDGR